VKPDAAGHGAKGLTAGRTASWVFRFRDRVTGKLRETGIGSYEDVTLAEARDRAADLRKQLRDGTDPIAARREARAAAAAAAAKGITFDTAAARYIEALKDGWRNPKHLQQWRSTINTYCTPAIGKLPVAHVELAHVMDILEPLWLKTPETAARLRGRIEAVLDAAKAKGLRAGENPARWRGHLSALLPKPAQVRKVRHFRAMPYAELPAFMRELLAGEGVGRLAMAWTILTAARTGEVTGMQWGEVAGDLWTIPAERMKAGRAHRVPLVPQALALLERRPREAPPFDLSENTMLFLLQREPPRGLGRPYTVHGFRSAFRDWAAEQTSHASEVIEMALAHSIRDKTEAAYRRGDLLDKRRALMRDWADYLLP